MKKVTSEISQLKAEKRKHKKHIKEDNKYVRKISRILWSKSFEKAMNDFEEIWDIKDELSKEIRSHLINLKNTYLKHYYTPNLKMFHEPTI